MLKTLLVASIAALVASSPVARNSTDFIATEIINGKPITPGTLPWLAAIRQYAPEYPMGWGYCTGALITTFPVPMLVTAAHCSNEYPPNSFEVYVNRYDSQSTLQAEKGLYFLVKKIIYHENYGTDSNANDVAVWVLELIRNPYNWDLKTYPTIALNTNPNIPTDGQVLNIAGWGVETYEAPDSSTKLMGSTVPAISSAHCQSLLGPEAMFPDQNICTLYKSGTTPTDMCQGDSGGSLFTKINGRDTAVGLVSWGIGCAVPNQPGVSARVSFFYPWILNKVVANGGKFPSITPTSTAKTSAKVTSIKASTTKTNVKTSAKTSAKTSVKTSAKTSAKTPAKTSAKTSTTSVKPNPAPLTGCGAIPVAGNSCNVLQAGFDAFCTSTNSLAWCEPNSATSNSGRWVVGVCNTGLTCKRSGIYLADWCFDKSFTPGQQTQPCSNKLSIVSPVKNQLDAVLPVVANDLMLVREYDMWLKEFR